MALENRELENRDAWIRETKQSTSLATLTDAQKVILANLPYIDLTLAGKLQLYEGEGIKLSDLHKYLSNPNESASGNIIPGNQFNDVSEQLLGDVIETDGIIVQNAVENGLGDIVLKDLTMDPETGFCAITFEDQSGNTGISYRGSDFDYENGAIGDWFGANIGGHLLGDSTQGQQASLYFLQNCDKNGNNYTYGYSLGGNLVQQSFRDNHALTKEAFSINGNPISPTKLNTQEIVEAFNSDKFNCCIIAGDMISLTKDNSPYRDNIRIIENVDGITTEFMAAHGLNKAAYDENGNFKTLDYEQTISQMKGIYENTEVCFGLSGWEAISLIQQADSWLTDKTRQAPDALKEAVIKQAIMENKIPVSFNEDKKPTTIFGMIADAWDWTKETVSTITRPVDNFIGSTFSLGAATITELFVCDEKINNNLEQWVKDISDINYGDWIYDISAQFGLNPQRLDGSQIKSSTDLLEWRQEIIDHMGDNAPQWLQEDIANIKIIKAVMQEEMQRIVNGESELTLAQVKEDPAIILDHLFGEDNKYEQSYVDLQELCKGDNASEKAFLALGKTTGQVIKDVESAITKKEEIDEIAHGR